MKETLTVIGIVALVVIVILAALLAFFLWKADLSVLGDKSYIVFGKVYAWIDAPDDATSKMYLVALPKSGGNIEQELEKVKAENINDMNIVPIESARLLIKPKSWVEDKGWEYYDAYRPADMSDSSGNVTSSWFGSTKPEIFLIKVGKPSYKEVIEEVDMSSTDILVMIAILVKEND